MDSFYKQTHSTLPMVRIATGLKIIIRFLSTSTYICSIVSILVLCTYRFTCLALNYVLFCSVAELHLCSRLRFRSRMTKWVFVFLHSNLITRLNG